MHRIVTLLNTWEEGLLQLEIKLQLPISVPFTRGKLQGELKQNMRTPTHPQLRASTV